MTWREIAEYAGKAGAKYPEVAAAQWALESAWGTAMSGKNNPYGIKGKGTMKMTTEVINGKTIKCEEEFKDFASVEEATKELVTRWYKDYKGHKGINRASSRKEACELLVKEGYATDPKYAEKLIDLLHRNAPPESPTSPVKTDVISLERAAYYYKREPHQKAAWEWLEEQVKSELPDDLLLEFTERYRTQVYTSIHIMCPYYYQRDSKTGHGERSCQSSAIAMVLSYIYGDMIDDDDDYLRKVLKHGDTVAQSAHQAALDELGVPNAFYTDGSLEHIYELLRKDVPVPVGILHKGPLESPGGGGHYVTIIGLKGEDFIVHDPFGKLDLKAGKYISTGPTDGCAVLYNIKMLNKRWSINGSHDGWYWDFS